MISFLTFFGVTALLFFQGWFGTHALLGGKESKPLRACLALPVAALFNAILVCVLTFTDVALTPLGILIGNACILAGFWLAAFRMHSAKTANVCVPREKLTTGKRVLLVACAILLAVDVGYAFSHAVLLPTFQYDSATNWTMRSRISYVDRAMAFDVDESRGMAKPNYPFLYHALQITANQGQGAWNDTAANAIHFLLSLSAFGAAFLLLRRMRGTFIATIAITVLLTIPLLALHLAQGFGDITLVQTLVLSIACLCMAIETHGRGGAAQRWLILSGAFAAACVWTKSEGIQSGLLPWILVVGLLCIGDAAWRTPALRSAIVAVGLSALWPIFALTRGLSLTPHGTDSSIACHPEAVHEAVLGLFSRGAFGIAWYAIPATVALLLVLLSRRSPNVSARQSVTLTWGGLTFVTVLFVYICTPNYVFLLKAESFYRQMLIPAALLIVSCAAAWNSPVRRQDSEDSEESKESKEL